MTAVDEVEPMRSEPTAVARIDAAQGRLEEYLENPSVARLFRVQRKYIEGTARIITEALVRGLKPPEFKKNVVAPEGFGTLEGQPEKGVEVCVRGSLGGGKGEFDALYVANTRPGRLFVLEHQKDYKISESYWEPTQEGIAGGIPTFPYF